MILKCHGIIDRQQSALEESTQPYRAIPKVSLNLNMLRIVHCGKPSGGRSFNPLRDPLHNFMLFCSSRADPRASAMISVVVSTHVIFTLTLGSVGSKCYDDPAARKR